MGWQPLHPDERVEHEQGRQSIKGRTLRYLRFIRYHPWPALRPAIVPLLVIALVVLVVVAAI